METEAFVRWALDDARTLEERCTTELMVERGVERWNSRQGIHGHPSFEERIERQRQRFLNPAHEPRYTEQALRRAAEAWREMKDWSNLAGFNHRPIRDLQVFRFLPHLEEVSLRYCEVADLSPLAELSALRKLDFQSRTCRDFRPLARCTALRDLSIEFVKHWPDVRGLENLPNVATLRLKGNLIVFERAVFPSVVVASLRCEPLAARNVRDLPQVPRCQFLDLGGIETLEGIEAFPELRNLVIGTDPESFEPLAALQKLTCLTVKDLEPVDVRPLTRVPTLQFLALDTQHKFRLQPVKPRDLAPLVESLSLRELFVRGSGILKAPGSGLLETEASAVQAGLPSWDDLILRPEPQPLPRLRLIAAPWSKLQRGPEEHRMPHEPEIIDVGLRLCELRWVCQKISRALTRALGTSDWGETKFDYPTNTYPEPNTLPVLHRRITVEFHSFGLLDKYPLFIETIRECLARFIPDYNVLVWNQLKAPGPEATPAQIEMEEKFRRERDEADFEQRLKDSEEYLQRLHRYELKKEDGTKVNPAEFAPEPRAPLPEPPWERDDDDDDDDAGGGDDDDSGDVAVKEKPDPPPSWLEDEHPLAGNYGVMAQLTLGEFWVALPQRQIVEYLLQRGCDEVIEEEKKE